jgi:hypothetical protein
LFGNQRKKKEMVLLIMKLTVAHVFVVVVLRSQFEWVDNYPLDKMFVTTIILPIIMVYELFIICISRYDRSLNISY